MKHTKRFLALLLALTLAFGIGVFATAEEEPETAAVIAEEAIAAEEPALAETAASDETEAAEAPVTASDVNWDDFYIITQPPRDLYVKRGESFTLSVEVNIPDGVEVTYEWYSTGFSGLIEGATAPALQLKPGDSDYPKAIPLAANYNYRYEPGGSHGGSFQCRIIANADGETKQYWSNYASVHVAGSFLEKLYSLSLEPFVDTFTLCANLFYELGPFGFLYYPILLIQRYIANYKTVF